MSPAPSNLQYRFVFRMYSILTSAEFLVILPEMFLSLQVNARVKYLQTDHYCLL
jgi:hypothetical protein